MPPASTASGAPIKPSVFSTQLRAKQLPSATTASARSSFRRYIAAAERRGGRTGEELLIALERRLDNAVYRLGFASTWPKRGSSSATATSWLDGKRVDIGHTPSRPGRS